MTWNKNLLYRINKLDFILPNSIQYRQIIEQSIPGENDDK